MTKEEIIEGLMIVHNYVSQVNESWSGGYVRVYAGSVVAERVKEAIPAAIELLKVVELSPPPADPPRGESSAAIHEHNISALSQWVEGLETALHRVEERLETVEAYNGQSFSQSFSEGWKREGTKAFRGNGIQRS